MTSFVSLEFTGNERRLTLWKATQIEGPGVCHHDLIAELPISGGVGTILYRSPSARLYTGGLIMCKEARPTREFCLPYKHSFRYHLF